MTDPTPPTPPPLAVRAAAEALGTAFLLAAVVGSGIMAERLAGGQAALALLANAIATGGVLYALILAFGPVSGAQFNPLVSLMLAAQGSLPWRELPALAACQVAGAVAGVAAAHAMFALPLLAVSATIRAGWSQAFSDGIASLGLLLVIGLVGRSRPDAVAAAVGFYIAGAYWFTASTSFANPAVTLARCLTDSFAGIRPEDAPAFILAQLLALPVALALLRLYRPKLDFPAPVCDNPR